MATLYYVPTDEIAKDKIGGDNTAEKWYASRVNDEVEGRGDGNPVDIKFAVGGTVENPSWGEPVSLGAAATQFDADKLDAGIQAGLTYKDVNVVLVECSASGGTENFYAVINGISDDHWSK